MAYKVFSNGDALTGSELNTYLMNQSVISFATATARDAALTTPTEGTPIVWLEDSNKHVYYTGSAWADLVSAAGSGNAIINGAFDIWQRGTSFTTAVYTADRWFTYFTGTSVTGTYTRQSFTPNELNVAGFGEEKYYFQAAVASGSDAATQNVLIQRLEDVRQLANQTVTLSFWAKATSGTPKIGANLRQEFGSGGSSGVDVNGQSATLSTSWARYSFTFTLPSISGKTIGTNSFTSTNIWFSAGSSAATTSGSVGLQTATFQVFGVQLESGSTATAFKRNASNIQGELAACQRYFYRLNSGAASGCPGGVGGYYNSTTFLVHLPFKSSMRVGPTLTANNAASWSVFSNGTSRAASAIALDIVSPDIASVVITTSAATAGQTGQFQTNASNGSIDFSAEL